MYKWLRKQIWNKSADKRVLDYKENKKIVLYMETMYNYFPSYDLFIFLLACQIEQTLY